MEVEQRKELICRRLAEAWLPDTPTDEETGQIRENPMPNQLWVRQRLVTKVQRCSHYPSIPLSMGEATRSGHTVADTVRSRRKFIDSNQSKEADKKIAQCKDAELGSRGQMRNKNTTGPRNDPAGPNGPNGTAV